jgi:non-specific protein-tyrosine kinase
LELREYIGLLRRWWWLVFLLAAAGGAAAFLLTPEQPPIYAATTTVLLSQGSEGLPDVSAVTAGQRLATTFGELMRTRGVLEQVITNLQLDTNPDTLAERVQVDLVTNTNLLRLTVFDTDPQRAAAIANEIVKIFILQNVSLQASRYTASVQQVQAEIDQMQAQIEDTRLMSYELQAEIEGLQNAIKTLNDQERLAPLTGAQVSERDRLQTELAEKRVEQDRLTLQLSQYQTRYQTLLQSYEEMRLLQTQSSDFMTVVEEAISGERVTSAPRKLVNALQGALAGIVLALVAVFVIEQLRISVKSSEEVERLTGLPTLGLIAEIKGGTLADKLVTIRQPRSPVAEAYRVLRTNIEFAVGETPIRTLVVTSTSPVEGKTTTAANLAISIAQSGRSVILADTDLRRPTLHKLFEQANTRGVTTALLQEGGSAVVDHLATTAVDRLFLLPSGPLPPNPADLLGSPRMAALVHSLSQHADVVIFDSPPLLAVADATLLARMCDAMLLVVLADATRADLLKRASEQILQSGINLLGVVLNRVAGSRDSYYHYYYYSSDHS